MSIFKDFFVKEKPVFTGIARGIGGFSFGAAAGGSSGPATQYGGSASGGTISGGIPVGNYRYFHISTETPAPQKNLVLSSDCPADAISILVGGGGGGGGAGHGGGGGGGGIVHLEFGDSALPAGTYPVSIGGGGNGGVTPPNIGTNGDTTTFGTNPSNYYISAGGGGRGGGWQDTPQPGPVTDGRHAAPGGSGGGGAAWPSGHGDGGGATSVAPESRFNGNANFYGFDGGRGDYSGAGGGGAGSVGQRTPGPASPTPGPGNPTSIPQHHPNYPNGGGGGSASADQFLRAEYSKDMLVGPFANTIWPPAADITNPQVQYGAFGGHGKSFPEFPATDLLPAIPSPLQTSFSNAVSDAGIFGGGGGGGAHGADNPYVEYGGGAGGTGGGGSGGRHTVPEGAGLPGAFATSGGGGGSGSQPTNGGSGGSGFVIVKIEMP